VFQPVSAFGHFSEERAVETDRRYAAGSGLWLANGEKPGHTGRGSFNASTAGLIVAKRFPNLVPARIVEKPAAQVQRCGKFLHGQLTVHAGFQTVWVSASTKSFPTLSEPESGGPSRRSLRVYPKCTHAPRVSHDERITTKMVTPKPAMVIQRSIHSLPASALLARSAFSMAISARP
jgi:hypothetical protein